jgi:hypothetical protein
MIDEIEEFAYLQENPIYQQDWEKAFRKNHSELTPKEIKQFIESIEGNELAQKYGIVCAFYYGKPLGEQLRAIYHIDLDKAVRSHIPIFRSFEHLYCSVRVIPHAPARVVDPDHCKEIEESSQPGHFLHRIDALMDKSPHLRDNRYLTVEIDMRETKTGIIADLNPLLGYYHEQIGPVKQEEKSIPDYDPLKVWKLVVNKLGKTPPGVKEANHILWQVARELENNPNAFGLWSEKRKTKNKVDTTTDKDIYRKLQTAFQIARRKILSFTPSEK